MFYIYASRCLPFAIAAILFVPSIAHAIPPAMQPDDFRACDIRQLGLSDQQRTKFQSIRGEYRRALEKAEEQNEYINHNRRFKINRILSDKIFNREEAYHYITERYNPSISFAVDELQIQYNLYQQLTPKQRKIWMQNCVK